MPNNERLEFLGDAVLGLSVASQLYITYPSRPESDISGTFIIGCRIIAGAEGFIGGKDLQPMMKAPEMRFRRSRMMS